jgi:hypothetical protein
MGVVRLFIVDEGRLRFANPPCAPGVETGEYPAPLHKGDNQPRCDQSLYACNRDPEIKTGHDVLRLELDPAGRCTSSCKIPSEYITRKAGFRSGRNIKK